MEGILRGRNCRVEVGTTEGAAKVVTAVTQANPPVVTSADHGLADGSVGYFANVVGMDQLNGQIVRVANSDAGTFECEGFDASDFDAFVSGDFIPITAYATLFQSTEYQLGGGSVVTDDATVLLDKIEQLEAIMLSAETVTINMKALEEENVALAKVRTLARSLTKGAFRITSENGAQRLIRGAPGLPGESLAVKGTGTSSLTITPKGFIAYLPAIV